MTKVNKRREMDVHSLMMSKYEVHIPDESSMHDFWVKFDGPSDTPYEYGVWKIHFILPKDYPYKSPSIGFLNKIFHPNIDERSGSVCLDVINQTWSPMFNLVNIMEMFLPQLLRYPNAADPLNGEAARLLLESEEAYNCRIRDSVKKYATKAIFADNGDSDNCSCDGNEPRKMSASSTNSTASVSEARTEDDDMDYDDNASDVSDMSDF